MTDLLLLGCGPQRTHELRSIFRQAGYHVIEVDNVGACCRRLQAEFRQSGHISSDQIDHAVPSAPPKGVTILDTAMLSASSGQPQLLSCIMDLARQLAPGWRLGLRHRRLEAPNGAGVELTSLEFDFMKIFTMVEVGETVSRKKIVQTFGEDYLSYDQNRLDTMVRRLRQKIESHLGIKLPLNTVRVRGFSFDDVLIIDP
ncbi:winged helix-turn-helix domain-containing protein [Pseudoduganella violacea]|uniref:OmpR/PhoB-type domain-containing protein n=1 Tax=Pseudoduganella violacea TaxID=1715466 RepID=A0A7W5B7K8_9BURK|nr:winged helix-turn-helix domain-containing protein [Pseudoduganella violacea]MBB3117999.1 hypothetical protein [Pseudoduganella violacea]